MLDLAPDYMLFIFLGSSAALWGRWVERVWPSCGIATGMAIMGFAGAP